MSELFEQIRKQYAGTFCKFNATEENISNNRVKLIGFIPYAPTMPMKEGHHLVYVPTDYKTNLMDSISEGSCDIVIAKEEDIVPVGAEEVLGVINSMLDI